MEWQTIDTAPKNGKSLLLTDGNEVVCGRYWTGDIFMCGHQSVWCVNFNSEFGCPDITIKPTHWMPLPEPPK